MHRLKKILSIIVVVCSVQNINGQNSEVFFHLQSVFSFGSNVTSVGLRGIVEMRGLDIAEASIGYGISRHFRNYGPDVPHWEQNVIGSVHYLWNEKEFINSDLAYNKYLDSGSAKNSIGYTFERYFNKIGTSQNVGTIHIRTENVYYHFSNDVFANTTGYDRFRSGAFGFGYIEGGIHYNLKLLIWTGESHCKKVNKVRDSDYPARWGYRDISECPYGDISHGILTFGVNTNVGLGQNVGAEIGLDSEKLRNVVQNKVFHDLYWIPRGIATTKNLHLPMKAIDGKNYMFEVGQEIRPNKFVWQLSSNASTLY